MNPWLFNQKPKGEKDEINNKISSSKNMTEWDTLKTMGKFHSVINSAVDN